LEKPYRILLYYKFVPIDQPEEFAAEHLAYCNELGLKGRILVANEGINGTVSGTVEQTQKYMDHMHDDPRFADLWFKISGKTLGSTKTKKLSPIAPGESVVKN